MAHRPCVRQRACHHRTVVAIQYRTCSCVITAPWWPSNTERVRVSSPHRGGHPIPNVCVCLHHNVVAPQSPGYGSTAPPGAVEPYPGASTIGRSKRATGLNKMRSPTKHGPIRPRVGMGAVREVTCTGVATSVLSHPFRVHSRRRTRPRVRTHALGRGSVPWALECHHVVVKRSVPWALECHHVVVKRSVPWALECPPFVPGVVSS